MLLGGTIKMMSARKRQYLKQARELLDRACFLAAQAQLNTDRNLPRIVRQIRALLTRAHARPEAVQSTHHELRMLGNVWLRRARYALDEVTGYKGLGDYIFGFNMGKVREYLRRGHGKPTDIRTTEQRLRRLEARQRSVRS